MKLFGPKNRHFYRHFTTTAECFVTKFDYFDLKSLDGFGIVVGCTFKRFVEGNYEGYRG